MIDTLNPSNVLAAVRHNDPYPFYSKLVTERPLYYDETLKAWVASSAEAVNAIVIHPDCAVRPLSAPVPPNLEESSAGFIFQHLIRMTEGEKQATVKSAIKEAMKTIPLERLPEISQECAKHGYQITKNLNQFAADLPIFVMADLLGLEHSQAIVKLIQNFALCLNPLNTTEQVSLGKNAADDLLQFFQTEVNSPFYQNLAERTSPDIAAANCIGLLFQSYEATNGLIGNSLQTLALYPEYREPLIHDDDLLATFMKEVSRWNPSVQNTRRYLTDDTTILGQKMARDASIILVLAAANRDPLVNPNPEQFLLHRDNPQSYTFGLGHHACIGEMIALTIAQAAMRQILMLDADLSIDPQATTYQAYGNLRVPNLSSKEETIS